MDPTPSATSPTLAEMRCLEDISKCGGGGGGGGSGGGGIVFLRTLFP